ncbi:MAG: class I SAM-dependent methyltransferase [Candidatus Bathyarchaeota archaeon]|nr:class I SAM-dependent methyltransferase [Candidatus Bathyarchaeota archaeon]
MYIKTRKTCRVCGSDRLIPILSLGEQFVTNFVEELERNSIKGPLELVLCDSKNGCGLLQLKHTLDHDVLYRKYWYKSGISTTMVKALADIVSSAQRRVQLSSRDIVVDIGSNDGTLLRQFKTPGLITVGFEPSNLWELGVEGTSKIINDYFNYKAFKREYKDKKAKLITSIAMFYDLEDPNAFVEDIKKCLHKDGLWIIQMNYLGSMLENNTFDNICHEHLEYYSLLSLEHLLNKHDMEAFDVELNDVNGGSFRIYIRHKGGEVREFPGAEERLRKLRDYEKKMELDTSKAYAAFAKRIETIKRDLMSFLKQEIKKGKKFFIYGASTRGLVTLQYFGIDKRLIKAAVDKNPDKCGKYIVGTSIPIMSIEEYRKEKPDYLLVLPYHFIEEIKGQEKEFLKKGGKMIVAIPKFMIITKSNC